MDPLITGNVWQVLNRDVAVCVCHNVDSFVCFFQSEDLCRPASRARCSTSHLGLPLVVGQGDLGTHPPSDSKVSYIVKLDSTHKDALTLSVILTFSHTLSEVITEWIICNIVLTATKT